MTQIRHPKFPKATRDVPETEAARWEKSGWVRVGQSGAAPQPKPAKKATTRKPRTRKKR